MSLFSFSFYLVIMSKEVAAFCEELRRDNKVELGEFKDSFERDLRKERRDIKASLSFSNKIYQEMKGQLMVALSETKHLKSEKA